MRLTAILLWQRHSTQCTVMPANTATCPVYTIQPVAQPTVSCTRMFRRHGRGSVAVLTAADVSSSMRRQLGDTRYSAYLRHATLKSAQSTVVPVQSQTYTVAPSHVKPSGRRGAGLNYNIHDDIQNMFRMTRKTQSTSSSLYSIV